LKGRVNPIAPEMYFKNYYNKAEDILDVDKIKIKSGKKVIR